MDIQQSLTWATQKLNKKNIQSAALDADILLSHAINKAKAFIYSHPDHQLTKSQLTKFKKLINRRTRGEPVAYLTGHKEFYHLGFIINKNVLVPRPETELLVDEVLKNKKIKIIADIGTGSGCIAISLAKNNSHLKIYASDISAKAINLAKKNSLKHKTTKRITFIKSDLLKPFTNIKLDAIVANLPYLDRKIKYDNLTIGLKFEPSIALYSGPDGLDAYRRLIAQIPKLKYPPQYIYLEIGHSQVSLIKKIIQHHLPAAKITLKKDLAGLNRIIMLRLTQRKTK